MKKFMILMFVGLVLVVSANAKDGIYIGFNTSYINQGDAESRFTNGNGATISTIKQKSATASSLVAGYELSDVKIEVEYLKQKNDVEKITAKTIGTGGTTITNIPVDDEYFEYNTLFVGGYKKFDIKSKTIPIIGAGFGSTTIKSDDMKESAVSSHFSAGIERVLTDNLSLSGMFRIISYGQYTYTDGNIDHTVNNSISTGLQIGIRYKY